VINNDKSFFKSSNPSLDTNNTAEGRITPELMDAILRTDIYCNESMPSSTDSEESLRRQDESLNEMINRLAEEDDADDKDFDVRAKDKTSFTKYFLDTRHGNEDHYTKDLESISAMFFLVFSFSFLLINH